MHSVKEFANQVREFFSGAWTVGDLVAFHSRHKLLLLAHSPEIYRSLGRLVAAAASMPRQEVGDQYTREFEHALAFEVTRGQHVNVLEHMAGYFKTTLHDTARAELHAAIARYAAAEVALDEPLALLRRHVDQQGVAYLAEQVYLRAF